jgi:hypothetical protein
VRIFISSPYSNGDQQANMRRQIDAAQALRERGHHALPPLVVGHGWDKVHPATWQEWMEWCLVFLPCCDAVLRLDGESIGADIEERAAKEIGMVVYRRIEDVPAVGKE